MLNKHLKKQFYDDGVNKEQALHYQAFVTDAILQYNLFLKRINHEGLCVDIIEKSVEFISNIIVFIISTLNCLNLNILISMFLSIL